MRTPRGRWPHGEGQPSPRENSRYPLSSFIQMWVSQSDVGARGKFLSFQVPCVSAESRPPGVRSLSGALAEGGPLSRPEHLCGLVLTVNSERFF